MIFINLSIGLLLVAIGLIVHVGKKYNLIAGYNTMDEEDKEAFDINKFALHFGITFYIIGVGIMISTIYFHLYSIDNAYWVLVLVALTIGGAGYLNIIGWAIQRKRIK